MINTILLDFGGTLDSDGGHWLDRFYRVYDQIGLGEIPRDRIKKAFYAADARAESDPAVRTAGYRDMMGRHVSWQFENLGICDTKREEGAAEAFCRPALRTLRRNRHILEKLALAGFRLGVISNFYGNVDVLCREAGYGPFLTGIFDSAVVGLRKPDAKFYEYALQRLGVSPGCAAMVGDSFDRDMLPSKALGMAAFWLVGGSDRIAPDASKIDGMLYSLEDLLRMVSRPGAGISSEKAAPRQAPGGRQAAGDSPRRGRGEENFS